MGNVSLQNKIAGVIGITLLALIVVLYIASQVIVVGSFADQENQETERNIERVESAIQDNLRSLEGTTRDWAVWDDTYNYVLGQDQSYFEANLVDTSSMDSNQLNLMIYIDKGQHLLFSKGFDYNTGEYKHMPESLRSYIYPGSPLLDLGEDGKGKSGIISLSEGPMLLAVEPILKSSGDGPSSGTLIFARFLNEDVVDHLAATTSLDVSLHAIDGISEDFKEVLPQLSEASPIKLQPLSSETIAGYALLDDIFGKPAIVLRVEMPREIYARGQQTLQYYLVTLLVSGVVFGVVILVLLEKLVLRRFDKLKKDMSVIETTSDASGKVAVSGSDEVASLAGSINSMLTALHRSREEQREGEERYRVLIEQITDALFLVDMETGRFLEANAAAQILLGYAYAELMELSLQDIVQPARERRTGILNSLRTTGTLHLTAERTYLRKNGTTVTVEVSDTHVTYGGKDALCMVARDITSRKKAEAVLRDLAMRDGLTGLYNRREMQRILKEQIELYVQKGQPSALLMLDMDHFKSINDTYGHQIGDDVLRWVSRLTQEIVRGHDKVARYGGEELAVVMPAMVADMAFDIAERVRLAIAARPFEAMQINDDKLRPVMIPITVSIGVAAVPDDAETLNGLIECADKALYEAKRRGRNCTVASSDLKDGSHLRIVR